MGFAVDEAGGVDDEWWCEEELGGQGELDDDEAG